MRKSLLLLALLSIWQAAWAQPFRFLPPAGERGRTGESLALPEVKIDRRVLRLAPGALVFDQNNRTLTHSQLSAGADVFFTRDQGGNILRMYILTDEERARLTASPPPTVAPAGVR